MTLDALLQPRSVAVLGASQRPSVGRSIVESLQTLGFPGAVYPVNPKYDDVQGLPCYASLEALPAAPDVVAFCLASPRILENFRRLPDSGARAAVIFDAGFAESGAEGRRRQAELVAICRDAGIALLGPNSMGSLSPWRRATTYLAKLRDPAGLAGNVALVSQSGSVCIGLLSDLRRFGFSHVISSGNEAVVTTADFIDTLVDDPDTKVIATFTETVNEPERYVAALDRAAAAGKPVVVLKVGRSERARQAIVSHTGGLAGEAEVFSALLRAHRAIEVRDLDEMTEVLAACQGARWPRGRRQAVVTASGGQAELILDLAAESGVQLPALPPAERAAIEAVVGPLTGDGNPTDMWGNGDYCPNLSHSLAVLRRSPENDAIVFCMDGHDDDPMERTPQSICADILRASAAESERPHYQMSMRPGLMDKVVAARLAEAGLATLGGARQGLLAIDRLARYVTWQRRPRAPAATGGQPLAGLLASTPARRAVHEYDAKRALAAYGLPGTREAAVASREAALAAAREIGYPVALKALDDGIPHKTDRGLVRLDIADPAALEAAWDAMRDRCAAESDGAGPAAFLVQEMVAGGVEVFAGVSRDPDFGLTLTFGIGGIAVEVLRDVALRMLPLAAGDAEAMIAEIRGAALLGPLRGGPAADVASLADCLYRLADFAVAQADLIEAIDLNPIKVLPQGRGCRLVDALIVLRGAGPPEGGGDG